MSLNPLLFWRHWKNNKPFQGYVISALIATMLLLHLINSDVVVAGVHERNGSSPAADRNSVLVQEPSLPLVEVTAVEPVTIQREIHLYGRTEATRRAQIKAEIAASVDQIELPEGQLVAVDQIILSLQVNNLEERLRHAQALLAQRQLEYESSQRLQKSGYQARLMMAEKATLLADAKANLAKLHSEKSDSVIAAPFAGRLNKTYVESGDYVQVGDVLAEVLELDPLVVTVYVPETEVVGLTKGQTAQVEFLDGQKRLAQVSYISAQSAEGTNTFAVELTLPNPNISLPAGISAKVALFTEELQATPISPAYLTINDQGQSGLYVLEDNIARFKNAKILKSNADQLWVSSLGENAKIIVAGHQTVLDGGSVLSHQYNQDGIILTTHDM